MVKLNPEYQNEDGTPNIEKITDMFQELFYKKADERRVIVHVNARGVLSCDDDVFIWVAISPDIHIHGTEEELKQIQERYERCRLHRAL